MSGTTHGYSRLLMTVLLVHLRWCTLDTMLSLVWYFLATLNISVFDVLMNLLVHIYSADIYALLNQLYNKHIGWSTSEVNPRILTFLGELQKIVYLDYKNKMSLFIMPLRTFRNPIHRKRIRAVNNTFIRNHGKFLKQFKYSMTGCTIILAKHRPWNINIAWTLHGLFSADSPSSWPCRLCLTSDNCDFDSYKS